VKRTFALAMTALMLVFTLTACGGSSGSTDSGSTGSGGSGSTATEESGGSSAGTNGGASSGAMGDSRDDVENAVDDALSGGNNTQSDQGGVSYGDMLENGTVEDEPTTGSTTNGQRN